MPKSGAKPGSPARHPRWGAKPAFLTWSYSCLNLPAFRSIRRYCRVALPTEPATCHMFVLPAPSVCHPVHGRSPARVRRSWKRRSGRSFANTGSTFRFISQTSRSSKAVSSHLNAWSFSPSPV